VCGGREHAQPVRKSGRTSSRGGVGCASFRCPRDTQSASKDGNRHEDNRSHIQSVSVDFASSPQPPNSSGASVAHQLHRLTPFRRDLFSFMNYGSREGTLSLGFSERNYYNFLVQGRTVSAALSRVN
jgi:hypothetical protein